MPTSNTPRGQRLDLDVLGEALASSPTTLRKGLAQFETPPDIAAALCTALPPCRPSIADLQCGHGSLLRAAANVSCGTLFGLDIDPAARIAATGRGGERETGGLTKSPHPQVPKSSAWRNCQRHLIHGDCTQVVPLLEEAGVQFDLLVLNPPWGLAWKDEGRRMKDEGGDSGGTVDSTLWTFLAAHRLLTVRGEGMLIAHAGTVRRLLEPHPLWAKTWLRLTCPNFFPGVRDTMLPEVAVIYFANDHEGSGPLEVKL